MSRYHPYSKGSRDSNDHEPPYHQGRVSEKRSVQTKDMSHEMRREREKPSRTLFVRNIDYRINQEEIEGIFSKYGPLSRVFNLIEARGLAFVTYFDIRHADKAKTKLQGVSIGNRNVTIHYSLPRDEASNGSDKEESNYNLGSVFVLIKNVKEVSNQEIYDVFSQWGEVREVRDGRGKNFVTKFVDYWDTRHAQNAISHTDGSAMFGGLLEARYANLTKSGREPHIDYAEGELSYSGPPIYRSDPHYDKQKSMYMPPPTIPPPYQNSSVPPVMPNTVYDYAGSVPPYQQNSYRFDPAGGYSKPPYSAASPKYTYTAPASAPVSNLNPSYSPTVQSAPSGDEHSQILNQLSRYNSLMQANPPPPSNIPVTQQLASLLSQPNAVQPPSQQSQSASAPQTSFSPQLLAQLHAQLQTLAQNGSLASTGSPSYSPNNNYTSPRYP